MSRHIITTCIKLLQSSDLRIKDIIRAQVDQFLEDTNVSVLEPGEQPANHEPNVFFLARADISYKVMDNQTGIRKVEWNLLPRDEMRPQVQLENGRTIMAILYQLTMKHQIAIDLDTWYIYNGHRWVQILSIAALRSHLREQYLHELNESLGNPIG